MRINRNFIAACMLAAFSIAAVEEPWVKFAQADSPAIVVGAEENQKKITEKSDSKFIMDKDLSEEMQKDLIIKRGRCITMTSRCAVLSIPIR